jgi:hypothetical protein
MRNGGLARVGVFATLAAGAAAAAACVAPDPPDTGDPALAAPGDEAAPPGVAAAALAGVPMSGYPSWDERLQLVAINRGRADPNNVGLGTSSSCSTVRTASPPLVYNFDAAQAARFHCRNLLLNGGGLSHDSFCTLRSDIEATMCDGAAACACMAGTECWSCATLGGCGTDPWTRTSYFGFTSASGEVGAAGYSDSWTAVEGWITECPATGEGHRLILTDGANTVVGPGSYQAGGGCWSGYFFSDLGSMPVTIPRIPSGIHYPDTGGAGTSFTFYANYYDGAGPPSTISVVIDGTCYPMTTELGTGGNRTYLYTTSLAGGCHEYYFLANDAGGGLVTYPSSGAYRFTVSGGTACGAGDYVTTQSPASCESPNCPDGTCGAGETCSNCAADCGACPPACGNGACEAGETCASCAGDCGACPPCTDGAMQVCGLGACAGLQTCAGATWGACDGAAPAAAETCGNGVDDDCNGLTDELCAPSDGGLPVVEGVPRVVVGGCGCRVRTGRDADGSAGAGPDGGAAAVLAAVFASVALRRRRACARRSP